MKPRPDCLPCILHQSLQVAREASDDEWSQRKVLNEVLGVLPEADWNQSPAEIITDALAQTRTTLRVQDPFAAPRAEAQKTFQALAEEFRERLTASDDPLALAITAAAAANLVDEMVFARFSRLDPKGIFEAALTAGFALGAPKHLTDALQDAKSVLYLLDNAGEVYFDKLLIDQLRAQGKTVRVVVRGGSLLHDATAADAIDAGLLPEGSDESLYSSSDALEADPDADPDATPPPPSAAAAAPTPQQPAADSTEDSSDDLSAQSSDTGAVFIPDLIELPRGHLGTPAAGTSPDLLNAIEDADVVIAKGSANYETFRSSGREVIYLLRAKCHPVAHSLGVQVGSLVLLRVTPTEDAS